jgi:hypothetical protein
VHPIGETRWEQVSVGADDVCPTNSWKSLTRKQFLHCELPPTTVPG